MKDFKNVTLWSPFNLHKLLTQFFSSQKTFFSSVLLGLNFNWNFFPTVYSEISDERERSSIFLMDGGVSSKGLWLADLESAPSSAVYILVHHHALQIWKHIYNVPWEACRGQSAKGGACTATFTLTVGHPASPCRIGQKGTLYCSNSHNLVQNHQ